MSAEAKAAGRGLYQNFTGTNNIVAYPDIGAAQSASTNAASGGSYTFAQ